MIGLARLIYEHGEALNYDLMTRTRYTLNDLGAALSEGAALSFVRYLPPDSALKREIAPDVAPWLTTEKTAALLAGIYDQLSWLQYTVSKAYGGKPKKPKPLPRPGAEDKSTRHIGKDPILVEEFDTWFYRG